MKILFLFLLVFFRETIQSIRKNRENAFFSRPFFDKSIDPKLFSQANSYYSSLLRKLSQENVRDDQENSEILKEKNENNEKNTTKALSGNEKPIIIQKKDEILRENTTTPLILDQANNNNETKLFNETQNTSKIEIKGNLFETIEETKKNNQSLFNSNIDKENPIFPSIFKEKLETDNNFLRKTRQNNEKITEGSFFSNMDFFPSRKQQKSQFFKKKHHEKLPDFEEDSFENAVLSKQMTNQMIKEKVANLTAMVDEYLNYKKKNQEYNGNYTKEIRGKSSKINKNMKKNRPTLGIQDNYFENDRELYNFYGVIPHFISFNE